MDAFIIELENRPGMLAGLAESIAGRGINITAIAGAAARDSGAVAIITNDEAAARSVLDEIGVTYRPSALVSAGLEDKPGALADAARRLADAGVNVEALIATGSQGGKITIAFAVDDPDAARTALGELAGAAV
ncbi:MAG TPA: ACT domain-containing protein [Candidatus Limnocylindria bacterium]|nr:ACT domain-containing protein [Candidatus Limnocylindria bacterium]